MRTVTRIFPLLFAALLLGSCMSPTDPDTPRIRITDPTRYFLRTYDFGVKDEGYDVVALDDGGFIVVGAAYVQNLGSQCVLLLRLDAEGKQLWVKTYGGTDDDLGYSVTPTIDGGFVFTGSTKSFTLGGVTDLWLVKTDADGAMQWSEVYGYEGYDSGEEVLELDDGGYVLVGRSSIPSKPGSSAWILRTNELGNALWQQHLGSSERDYGSSLKINGAGDLVVAGTTEMEGDGSSAIWMFQMEVENGVMQWQRLVDGQDSKSSNHMVLGTDGSIAVVGHVFDVSSRQTNMYFVKSDLTGDMITERTLHDDAIATSIEITSDNGYIVCGYTNPYGGETSEVILLKLDKNGNTLWKKIIGGQQQYRSMSVTTTLDGGFILTGSVGSSIEGNTDLLVIKCDANGQYEG